jgi:hypothetical protein
LLIVTVFTLSSLPNGSSARPIAVDRLACYIDGRELNSLS